MCKGQDCENRGLAMVKDYPEYPRIYANDTNDMSLDILLGILDDKMISLAEMESLRGFTRRIEYFEILLRVLQNRESNSVGLNELPSLCRFGTMHHQSLTKFIRDQVAAGTLYVEQGDRRDKKVVRASEATIADLTRLLDLREG